MIILRAHSSVIRPSCMVISLFVGVVCVLCLVAVVDLQFLGGLPRR
jgi:hypothetical protein